MPQIGFNSKKVLSTNLIYVGYELKLPFLLETSRCQKNMNLATVQASLGLCWAAVEGAKFGITPQLPPPRHRVALCTLDTAGHRLDITA